MAPRLVCAYTHVCYEPCRSATHQVERKAQERRAREEREREAAQVGSMYSE